MAFANPDDDTIRDILSRPMTIAVIGCSPDEDRTSHRIARFLQNRGHRIIPINPSATEILGEAAYASLDAVPSDIHIDMIDVFRRPVFVRAHINEAIRRKVPIVWTQLDVVDEAAALTAQQAGCTVIMDRCPAIEYRRLF